MQYTRITDIDAEVPEDIKVDLPHYVHPPVTTPFPITTRYLWNEDIDHGFSHARLTDWLSQADHSFYPSFLNWCNSAAESVRNGGGTNAQRHVHRFLKVYPMDTEDLFRELKHFESKFWRSYATYGGFGNPYDMSKLDSLLMARHICSLFDVRTTSTVCHPDAQGYSCRDCLAGSSTLSQSSRGPRQMAA